MWRYRESQNGVDSPATLSRQSSAGSLAVVGTCGPGRRRSTATSHPWRARAGELPRSGRARTACRHAGRRVDGGDISVNTAAAYGRLASGARPGRLREPRNERVARSF